jgi:thymidylate synthase (FAD)
MHRVTPKVFLVGGSVVFEDGMKAYLKHIGASDWKTNAPSPAEKLTEFYGRLCYRSWKPGMNKNVTRVRTDNKEYIQNIAKVKHGSVLEHAVSHWVFADVSRVFTHELVRHRAGTAFSQESLRFVRLDDLGLWLPDAVAHDRPLKDLFEQTFKSLEEIQARLAIAGGLDDEKRDFGYKKTWTSRMRRLAPEGLATTIGFSGNFRALRHILEMRTAVGAEEEIRLVFDQVMTICKENWPNVFDDFTRNKQGEWVPLHSKV